MAAEVLAELYNDLGHALAISDRAEIGDFDVASWPALEEQTLEEIRAEIVADYEKKAGS